MIKKIFSLNLAILIFISMFSQSFVLSDYTLERFNIVIGDKILKNEIVLLQNGRTLVPIKKVANMLNLSVEWNEIYKIANIKDKNNKVEIFFDQNKVIVNNNVQFIDTYSKMYNDTCYVPARFIADIFGISAGWDNASKTITLGNVSKNTMGIIKNELKKSAINLLDIKTSFTKKSDVIELKLNGVFAFKDFKIDSPTRVILDFHGTLSPATQKSYDINVSTVKQMRVGQFKDDTVRLVLDLEKNGDYNIKSKDEKIFISLEKNQTKSPTIQPVVTATPRLSPKTAVVGTHTEVLTATPKATTKPQLTPAQTPKATTIPLPEIKNSNISKKQVKLVYRETPEYDEIELDAKVDGKINYSRLTDPDRILVKLPFNSDIVYDNNIIPKKHVIIKDVLKSIEWGNNEQETTLYFDLKKQYNFEVDNRNGKIYLKIFKKLYDKFKYFNNGDRVYIEFLNLQLNSDEIGTKQLYTDKKNTIFNKYSMKFDNKILPISNYKFNINDKYLKNIEFVTQQGKTDIIFNGNQRQEYLVSYRKSLNSSTVTMIKPANKGEKIIVIDAGHGGVDSGASNKLIKEKEINLDIANSLNQLLKSNNIKTYMIRSDDTYVGLYERVNIANKLNGYLFTSVHNNAYYSQFSGTETLYFPSQNNVSKAFATVVQDKLIQTLGFKNRGIVKRPNLVVLKETHMPSILAEIGFITNENEYSQLLKTTTRYNAAKALNDAVVEFLGKQIL